jgi:hypothetical protein
LYWVDHQLCTLQEIDRLDLDEDEPTAAMVEEEPARAAEESAPAPQAESEAPAVEATFPEASIVEGEYFAQVEITPENSRSCQV